MNQYNFGCMAASDSMFDIRGWVFGGQNIAEIKGLRDVAMTTNFGTKIAISGFASCER